MGFPGAPCIAPAVTGRSVPGRGLPQHGFITSPEPSNSAEIEIVESTLDWHAILVYHL